MTVPRYIDVDELIKNHNVKYKGCTEEFAKGYMAAHNDWTRLIMSAPVIKTEAVRHGRWVENENQSTREAVLNEAIQCVCGHRVSDYGKPEDSFGQIAAFWNAYLGMDKGITALDVCNMMALLKMARIMTGTATEDSFVDLAGYAACGAEIAEAMKK